MGRILLRSFNICLKRCAKHCKRINLSIDEHSTYLMATSYVDGWRSPFVQLCLRHCNIYTVVRQWIRLLGALFSFRFVPPRFTHHAEAPSDCFTIFAGSTLWYCRRWLRQLQRFMFDIRPKGSVLLSSQHAALIFDTWPYTSPGNKAVTRRIFCLVSILFSDAVGPINPVCLPAHTLHVFQPKSAHCLMSFNSRNFKTKRWAD